MVGIQNIGINLLFGIGLSQFLSLDTFLHWVNNCPPKPTSLSSFPPRATSFYTSDRLSRLTTVSISSMTGAGTLGRFIGVRDNLHFTFICRWLCVFTRTETAVTKNLFIVIMSTTNATDLNEMTQCAGSPPLFNWFVELAAHICSCFSPIVPPRLSASLCG